MKRLISLSVVMLSLLVGCSAGPATLDLIAVGEAGLIEAKTIQTDTHQELMDGYTQQQKSLNTAFEQDIKAAFNGQTIDPQTGKPLVPTADWIISTQKVTALAANIIANEKVKLQNAYNIRQDNLRASLEALQMARALTLQTYNLGAKAKLLLQKYAVTWRTMNPNDANKVLSTLLENKPVTSQSQTLTDNSLKSPKPIAIKPEPLVPPKPVEPTP